MNRDEILAMAPGPEMDRMVTEQVMGWTYVPKRIEPQPNTITVHAAYVVDEDGDPYFGWSPSTDIAAAWEVETKIEEIGLRDNYGFNLATILEAYDVSVNEVNVDAFKIAHASPSDRCKAALLAVMEG